MAAEIRWITLNTHGSYKSSVDISSLLQDSLIAKYFKCAESKSAYLSTFGITPYFREELEKSIKQEFVRCLDESMHKQYQKKQMDVHVQLWDVNKVATRFLGSELLRNVRVSDLKEGLYSATQKLKLGRMFQL